MLPDVLGGIDSYRELVTGIPGQVWGIPGMRLATAAKGGSGWLAAADLDQDCRAYARAVLDVAPHGPLRIGGWSFGGTLAIGTAYHLRALGAEVDHVVVVDTVPPNPEYWHEAAEACEAFLAALDERPETAAADVPFEVQRMLRADTPADSATLRRSTEAIMHALYALAAYRPPQAPVAARLTFVRAADSALGDKHAEYYRRLPSQDFASVVLPGDHFSILSADRSRQLAECFCDPTGRIWRAGEGPEDQ